MISVGAKRLEDQAEFVNSLNVFPMPDGDTGTNMSLSFSSGYELVKTNSAPAVGEVAQDLAKGLLMGARGNSGVILSQLFRGFAKGCEAKEVLSGQDLAEAFNHGVETAYQAVMKPVEGTILTVAREAAEAGMAAAKQQDDPIYVMEEVHKGAEEALIKTPELLPVLKEVGVVDSGGQGLFIIYTGFLEALKGEKIELDDKLGMSQADVTELAHQENYFKTSHAVSNEDITYGYCTEIMVKLGEGETVTDSFDYETFRNFLNDLGDSLLVVNDEEVVKVHVHTEHPGQVLEYGQKFGSLIKIKVDNMRLQHDTILEGKAQAQAPAKPKEKIAVIAVAAGQGIQDMFQSLGVSKVINGGQTMNPSTEDIVKAAQEVNAESYLILPNNKNIFMSSKQAADILDQETRVVESKSISQGLTAMLGYNPEASLDDNADAMTSELAYVKSGQVTTSVRDTKIGDLEIKEGDYMGIVDGDIIGSQADRQAQTLATVEAMLDEDSEIVTLFFGEGVDQAEADALAEDLEAKHPDLEFEVHEGKQPVYAYLISVE
ncbi:DAK2 domain-containing protein [Aerococcus sp. UMB9870]|uniref:DAK2 domain-containing protein n=1 Tax=Aerococcus sp. UMB9870 TaxID=3046351 RepID=UPI00254FA3DA|nr:DAK2 domain-containing protein [Aerococcus sp. UMB9870]MDK6369411.1 DAK2 domain-containing protein [Aerococcus sp. UMB9870]